MANAPLELIERVRIFSGLDRRELRVVADSLKDRTFVAGSAVIEEGTSGIGFFVIESGTATVTVAGHGRSGRSARATTSARSR